VEKQRYNCTHSEMGVRWEASGQLEALTVLDVGKGRLMPIEQVIVGP
jgi:hypothetical protein